MERFVHNLELFYSGIRLSGIGLDKRLDVSSFVGSHLTMLEVEVEVEVACWHPPDTWYQAQPCSSGEWWCPGPVMTTSQITPTFLATNLHSINCGGKGFFTSVLFLLCCYEIVFLLPSPPLLLQMTWRPPTQQTKQWCRFRYDKWNTKNINLDFSSPSSYFNLSTIYIYILLDISKVIN